MIVAGQVEDQGTEPASEHPVRSGADCVRIGIGAGVLLQRCGTALALVSMALPSDPHSWTVEQVALMLEEVGLGHVAPAFRANAVTGADLVSLSQQELQDFLELTPLQARKVRSRVGCAPTPYQ